MRAHILMALSIWIVAFFFSRLVWEFYNAANDSLLRSAGIPWYRRGLSGAIPALSDLLRLASWAGILSALFLVLFALLGKLE